MNDKMIKIMEEINIRFKDKQFDHIEYNEIYKEFELHFKDKTYFHLHVDLSVGFRQIHNYQKERETK